MCTKCKNKVFLFRMMHFGRACKKCEVEYWEQQKRELFIIYSSGQNKVPTAELKSRLIVVQKSFDSRLIVVL